MYSSGLLVLSTGVHLAAQLSSILRQAAACVSSRLYVHLRPENSTSPRAVPPDYCPVVAELYSASALVCPALDVRVLLSPMKAPVAPLATALPVDLLLWHRIKCQPDPPADFLQRHVPNRASHVHTVCLEDDSPLLPPRQSPQDQLTSPPRPEHVSPGVFERVAVGGTWDGLHAGHRLLLSSALLHCSGRLTVGVSSDEMVGGKLLAELIPPCEQRCRSVQQFVDDVDNTVKTELVTIHDPMGPTRDDPDLQLLVVSAETEGGASAINTVRAASSLPPMQVYSVPVIDKRTVSEVADDRLGYHESKLSSSGLRVRQLGRLLRPRLVPPKGSRWPYVIGVTGGLASGKTSVCAHLRGAGARVIDCDRLAHGVFVTPDSDGYNAVVQHFGQSIVGSDGSIDRRILADIVFSDPEQLRRLTDIVWPLVASEAERLVAEIGRSGEETVVVMEAALLLEAGWQRLCHEVWVCTVSPDEAVRRSVERDGVTAEHASGRLKQQMTNSQRAEFAHIVFCSFWEPEFTRQQVDRAWEQLKSDLQAV